MPLLYECLERHCGHGRGCNRSQDKPSVAQRVLSLYGYAHNQNKSWKRDTSGQYKRQPCPWCVSSNGVRKRFAASMRSKSGWLSLLSSTALQRRAHNRSKIDVCKRKSNSSAQPSVRRQRCNFGCGQGQAHHLIQKGGGFFLAKT